MTEIIQHPGSLPRVRKTPERMDRQGDYFTCALQQALNSRRCYEEEWDRAVQQYEAIPDKEFRTTPVAMRNIEVPLGAWAAEQSYAQMIAVAEQTKPPVTVQTAPSGLYVQDARDIQFWLGWVGRNELHAPELLRSIAMDFVVTGLGVGMSSWSEWVVRNALGKQIIRACPRLRRIRPKNFLVPDGDWDSIEDPPWVAVRWWLRQSDMDVRARSNGWDTRLAQPTDEPENADQDDDSGTGADRLYSVWQFFARSSVWYDDEDIPADLLVSVCGTSHEILKVDWSPYRRRPFSVMRYQRRTDTFWPMGVMKMVEAIQHETSDMHQDRTAGRKLALKRLILARNGTFQGETEIDHGTVLEFSGEPPTPWVIPPPPQSELQEEMAMLAMAQQRSGVAGSPGPEAGQRTPATTESIKSNQRNAIAAPKIAEMATAYADWHQQAAWRYAERLLDGDPEAERRILACMGDEKGQRIIDRLVSAGFDEEFAIEMTASSATLNRDAEQARLMQVAPIVQQYHMAAIQGIAAMRQAGDPTMQEALRQAIMAQGEVTRRLLATFDVRDYDELVLDLGRPGGADSDRAGAMRDDLAQPNPAPAPGVVDQAVRQAALGQPTQQP